jgi:Transposon-encoded protein TnpV
MDPHPLAAKFGAEHKRFLEEHNPAVLRGLSDSTSYLSSVGETAADRCEHLMFQYMQSPAVKDLPHQQRVRELQSRHHEVEELIRHDLIFQPLPESQE